MSSDHVHDMLAKAAQAGERIRGGCDRCTAYQTLSIDTNGVWHLIVHHDDWCPFLRSRSAGRN
jgi:hypothetical protein